MNATSDEKLITAAVGCAQAMAENAAYILRQLPSVAMPDMLRSNAERACAMWEEAEVDLLLAIYSPGAPQELPPLPQRISQVFGERVKVMNDIVIELQASAESEPRYRLACILFAESATNVLDLLPNLPE